MRLQVKLTEGHARGWCLVVVLLATASGGRGESPVTAGSIVEGQGHTGRETARLITGPSEHLNYIRAGGTATAEIRLTPAATNANGEPYGHGGAYSPSDISGQTLTVDTRGFRSFWHVQVTNWDPEKTGSPLLRSLSGRIDAESFRGANALPPNPGVDLKDQRINNLNDSLAGCNSIVPFTVELRGG